MEPSTNRPELSPDTEGDNTTPQARQHQPGPYLQTWSVGQLVATVLLLSLDALFAKRVFDIMVNASETMSWLVAIGVTGIGAFLAYAAGKADVSGKKTRKWLNVAAFAAIGLAMATIRFYEQKISGYDEVDLTDRALAALMLTVYLGGGYKIYQLAGDIWRPDYSELRTARRKARNAERKQAKTEATYARLHYSLTEIENARTRLGHELTTMLKRIDHMQQQLHAAARDELVLQLGDTTQTAAYRTPIDPPHPLPRLSPEQPPTIHKSTA